MGAISLIHLVLPFIWPILVKSSPVHNQCVTHFNSLKECPDFLDAESWHDWTDQCCTSSLQTESFHCLENDESNPVVTCQNVVRCEKGTYASFLKLTSGQDQQSHNGEIVCLPCTSGLYEPQARDSNQFRYQRCSQQIQVCRGVGEKVSRNGSASEDALCTCDWEAGWGPYPMTHECTDPSGFGVHSDCVCHIYDCSTGTQLNSKFKCTASGSQTSVENVMTPSTRFTNMTAPSLSSSLLSTFTTPTFNTTPEDRKREEGFGYMIATVVAIGIISTVLVILAFYCVYVYVYAKPCRSKLHTDSDNEDSKNPLNSIDDQSEDSVVVDLSDELR